MKGQLLPSAMSQLDLKQERQDEICFSKDFSKFFKKFAAKKQKWNGCTRNNQKYKINLKLKRFQKKNTY
jgi:hypothetical protein